MQVFDDICQSSASDAFGQPYSATSLATADLGKPYKRKYYHNLSIPATYYLILLSVKQYFVNDLNNLY